MHNHSDCVELWALTYTQYLCKRRGLKLLLLLWLLMILILSNKYISKNYKLFGKLLGQIHLSSLQGIMLAVNIAANHRYIQGWHLYQMWHVMVMLYAYRAHFISGSGGVGGGVFTANTTAKLPNTVWIIPLDFFKDTCRHFQLIWWQT